MRLFYYETLKLIKRKSFWLLLVGAIALNAFMVNVTKRMDDEDGFKQHYYEEIQEQIQNLSIEDSIQWMTNEIAFYGKVDQYAISLVFPEDFERPAMSEDEIQIYERYENVEHYWNAREKVIYELLSYYEKIKDYPTYLDKIQEAKEQVQTSPLWNLMSENEKKEVELQAQSYEKLIGNEVSIVNYRAIDVYSQSMISRLLCLLLLCSFVILYLKEDEESMNELVSSTSKGGKEFAIAKIVSYICVALCSVFLLQLTDLLTHLILYGGCDFSVAIQSIPSFYQCPYTITILEWLIVSITSFTIGVTLFSLLFVFIYHLFENKILSFIVFFVFVFIEALFYTFIPKESIFAEFVYVNIFSLFDGTWFGTYSVYQHIFSWHIPSWVLLLLLCVVIAIVSGCLFVFLYHKQVKGKRISLPILTIRSTKLWMQEGYRILVINKGGIILLLTCVIACSLFVYRYQKYEALRDEERYVYSIYEKYEGEVTDEKILDIEIQLEKFANKEKEYLEAVEQYKNEEIEYDTFLLLQNSYNMSIYDRNIYEELYTLLSSSNPYLVYHNGFDAYFALNYLDRDNSQAVLVIIALLLWISAMAYKNEEEKLYVCTYKGIKYRRNAIYGHIVLGGFIMFLFIELCSYLHFNSLYPMHDFNTPMSTLLEISGNVPIDYLKSWNAGQYLLALCGVRILGVISLILMGIAIFRFSKNRILGLLIGVALFLIPMFLYYNGFSFMSMIGIFDLIMGNLFLQKTYSILKLLGLLLINSACVLYIHYSYKRV